MSTKAGKLFLLDAMALIYRAHFAFSKNPRVNSKGMNTGAIYGFMNSVLDILKKEKPTHIGVAFDTKAPTFRHIEFEAYKAHRDKQPEDISDAIPFIFRILNAMEIPILALDGFEADDIIGTLAKKAQAENFEVFMVSIDKDYAQLVDKDIYLYKVPYAGNKNTQILGVEEVIVDWEINHPLQVIDILGLQGDAADNIPGIPGIGGKRAVSLIQTYGSIENLIASAEELSGKMKENVIQFAQQGLLSKKLATICLDVPIAFEADALKVSPYKNDAFKAILDELEFKTIKSRIFGEDPSTSTKNVAKAAAKASYGVQLSLFDTVDEAEETQEETAPASTIQKLGDLPYRYHLLTKEEEVKFLATFLERQTRFCFDTETDGLNALESRLLGASFSYIKGEAYYISFPEDRTEVSRWLKHLEPALQNPKCTKIAHNLKFDYQVLEQYGISVQGPIFDTMIAHYLLSPEGRHGMDHLSEILLNYEPVHIEELIGKKGKKQGSMADLSPEEVYEYACEDADITLQLYEILAPSLQEDPLKYLFDKVEMPVLKVLADMERLGIAIDSEALNLYSKELEKEIAILDERVQTLAGQPFNLSSPKQLGDILFDTLKLDPNAKRTSKSKQYQTNEEVLQKLVDKHPIVADILTYRQLQKLKSTYVDTLPLLCSEKDGRIHTSYQQTVAVTGRLSSNNPNLQNIPIRTDRGREIRKAFISGSSEYVIASADYSQIELRIMAEFSKDESMLEAFTSGRDIHTATAAKIFKVSIEEVTSDMRRKAKTANFGIIYGISAQGLSQRLSISRTEAGELIRSYFEEFPAVKKYMDEVVNTARTQEYVETILGRRRYLRDINSRNATLRSFDERNAINAPIQGSAADIIKLAMIDVHEYLVREKKRSRMLLQVHDELVFEIHKEEWEDVSREIVRLMEHAYTMAVPLVVEIGKGENWLDAH